MALLEPEDAFAPQMLSDAFIDAVLRLADEAPGEVDEDTRVALTAEKLRRAMQ